MENNCKSVEVQIPVGQKKSRLNLIQAALNSYS